MKPGKNDPCPCGSGKKYKHCCEGKTTARSTITVPTIKELNQLVAFFNAGHFTEVERQTRLLTEQFPNFAPAWKLLGACLHRQEKSQEALPALLRATELLSNDAEAHYNLGVTQENLGQANEAVASYQQALKLAPDLVAAHNNLGSTLRYLNRLHEAVASCRRALQINPNYAGAYQNLGNALVDLGQISDAAASYRKALQIDPTRNQAHSNLLFCLSHSQTIDAQALFIEHLRFAEQFEASLRVNWLPHNNSRDPERCLKVGFVSGDLRNHAVAFFIEPILAHLSTYPTLSLHAYYNHPIADGVTQRLQQYITHWHSISNLSDAVLAQNIRNDGIDILIDLTSHTALSRLVTFAHKPAPIQVSWMGYPGTTGLHAMNYFLADCFQFPQGEFENLFTEKIVRLPANAPFSPSSAAPPISTLPALSNGYITFGSFSRMSKLNPTVIALWSQLLNALPDSKIVLGNMNKDEKYDPLIDWFARAGVKRERLEFHPKCDMSSYMNLHNQIDICLNPFPYTGGTTLCHALWMGVPTLTLAGTTIPGRGGASILGGVGLDNFIASDATDFTQKGLFWTENLAALSDIRAGLRDRFAKSARGQPAVIAASLEHALRIMWQRWCSGLPAEAFEVTLEDANRLLQKVDQ